jgi:hypothetical protein
MAGGMSAWNQSGFAVQRTLSPFPVDFSGKL